MRSPSRHACFLPGRGVVDAKAGEHREWTIPVWSSEEYIDQITAEHKVMVRDRKAGKPSWIWVLRDPGLANHFLDREVGNVAIADMKKVGSMSASGEAHACGRVFRKAAGEKETAKAPGDAAWAHPSAKRCVCRELMAPYGTRYQGRVKRWKCPACDRTEETTGTAV